MRGRAGKCWERQGDVGGESGARGFGDEGKRASDQERTNKATKGRRAAGGLYR